MVFLPSTAVLGLGITLDLSANHNLGIFLLKYDDICLVLFQIDPFLKNLCNVFSCNIAQE